MNEKHLIQTEFTKPTVLVTYDGNVVITEKVKVRTYDMLVDGKQIAKLEVLFAFPLEKFEVIKADILLKEKVAEQNLKSIQKPKDRPHVATNKEYKAGTSKHVKLTMRTGHILSGEQLANTKYNLIVKVCAQPVLVYKHGILEYETQQEGETDGSRTEE